MSSNKHREDILRAAIDEFGKMGYTAASTNEIVKNAKVSKGLLFHHFINKEKLYVACQAYVLEQYGQFMAKNYDDQSSDFFERILKNLHIKMKFGCENPEFLSFINRDIDSLIAQVSPMRIINIFEGVDRSLFRDGLELGKILDYVRLALEASWARYSRRHGNRAEAMVNDMASYFDEAEEILNLLKHGAYKEI